MILLSGGRGDIDEWVSVTDPMGPICKLGVFWGILPKKASNLAQIMCFSAENGILKVPQLCFLKV